MFRYVATLLYAYSAVALGASVDVSKVNMVEIGGSGARMQALLSGRVQAVPVHFDQAAEVGFARMDIVLGHSDGGLGALDRGLLALIVGVLLVGFLA